MSLIFSPLFKAKRSNKRRELNCILFALMLSACCGFSFSQEQSLEPTCEAGSGVLIYTEQNGDIYLLLADHDNKNRGWASFGGNCADKNNSVRKAAAEELKEETRGYYSIEEAEKLIDAIDPIQNLNSEGRDFYTYVVKVSTIDTANLNTRPPLSSDPKDNERDTYHLFKLSDLICRIEKSEDDEVKIDDIEKFPKRSRNGKKGLPSSELWSEFKLSLQVALEKFQPFVEYKFKHQCDSTDINTAISSIKTDPDNPVINKDNCIRPSSFYVNPPEEPKGTVHKRIILRKDGLTLNDIPQYGYKEKVYFEIEDLENDEAAAFIFAYKYLETMDQPFLIHQPDGFGKRVKSGDKIFFEIPAHPDELRNRKKISGDTYQRSKNRESFLVYNLYKIPQVVDPACLAMKKEELSKKELANQETLDRIIVIEKDLEEFPETYATSENADSIALKHELEKEINQLDTLIAKYTEEIKVLEKQITFYEANYYVAGTPAKLQVAYDALLNLKRVLGAKKAYRTNRNRLKTLVTTRVTTRNKKLKEEAKKTEPYLTKQRELSALKAGIIEIASLRSEITKLEKLPRKEDKITLKAIKLGGLVKGNTSRTISYELGYKTSQKENEILDIKRMGNFPVLTERDHIYALITNRIGQGGITNERLEGSNYSISLSILEKDTVLTLPNDVRPSKIIPAEELFVPQSARENFGNDTSTFTINSEGKIYQDLLLPFGRTFRRNSLVKARFHGPTYTPVYDTKGKLEGEKLEYKLLMKETYPQIRGLYGFNLSTGVISSFVCRKRFSKVPVTSSSSNTFTISEEDIDEARILPMIALTIYWKPVDIQRPPQWSEMIPNPTIGFDFTSPTNEIFLGFSSEFIRNVQLIYGVHFSKVDVLAENQNLSTADAPKVEKKFASGAFVGLTFNFNLIPSLYKQHFTKKD